MSTEQIRVRFSVSKTIELRILMITMITMNEPSLLHLFSNNDF